MKRAVIFLNGTVKNIHSLKDRLRTNDVIIAADGGSRFCHALKIQPDFIVGDMDSISQKILDAAENPKNTHKKNTKILRYPSEKNETDFELAINLALTQKIKELLIVGISGKRMDMTLGNILALRKKTLETITIEALAGNDTFMIMHAGKNIVTCKVGARFSIIPLSEKIMGITILGAKYELHNENLEFGSGRGLSNITTHKKITVEIKQGNAIFITNSHNLS